MCSKLRRLKSTQIKGKKSFPNHHLQSSLEEINSKELEVLKFENEGN